METTNTHPLGRGAKRACLAFPCGPRPFPPPPTPVPAPLGPSGLTGIQALQGVHHAVGKLAGILFAAEVEPPDLAGIAPLVEVGRGLVVLQPLHDGTVDDHLRARAEQLSSGGPWQSPPPPPSHSPAEVLGALGLEEKLQMRATPLPWIQDCVPTTLCSIGGIHVFINHGL